MKKRVGLVSIVLVAAGLLPCFAWAAANTIAPAPVKTGEIRGAVAYCGPGGNSGIGIYIPGRSYQTTLGANGQFVFSFVPPGTYNLTVQIPGHAGDVIPNVVVADNTVTDLGSIALCRDSDHDGFTEANDCNDNNPMVNPNAAEACDGLDNNCNAQVDEGCALCTDADQDGFHAQSGCLTQRDCNDSSATVRPNADEVCDTVDNNCNGLVDEGFILNSDPYNCGACGNVCSFTNASTACNNGQCQFGTCEQGFQNCNDNLADGCEANLLADSQNCGTCGTTCSANAACSNGQCVGILQLQNGAFCSANADCASGSCVDNVCCNSSCDGTCVACNLTGSAGSCTSIPNGQDPAQECGGISCAGFYYGWVGDTCFLKADAAEAQASCSGSGTCRSLAAECSLVSLPGAAAVNCNDTCQTPTAGTCTGTIAGMCDNLNLGNQTCGTGACQRTVPICQNGAPNTCVPGLPSPEVCGNGIDDDCDGLIDEGCS